MEEKELKTSKGQRIAIGVIAFFMLGSIIASYAAIVVSNTKSTSANSGLSEERLAYYQNQYSEQVKKFKEVSADDYTKFSPYLSEVKAYNENNANENGVQIKDLVTGTGRALETDDGDYLAYYVGWCADEKIFDSSLDSETKPTAFAKALDVSTGMIEGWYQGMSGMKLGGIREFVVPGNLAYGDKMELCGGYNKPLKFLVMAVAAEDPLKTVAADLDVAYLELQYANAGIDYEKEYAAATKK
ncbi:FKBP-type peptidyl-prolyl cis-trans isomerase [Candidatus Saccharibacteria bacterium]|nr:FKBP-type peptidyl-prolyl cis-trans isomerase [Candidatus Saccharibacteria bacterium]